ncbi:PilN domain-containing protein [Patescibacteria group bacterium]|nr:PilN domain-containing protein [Patescibacteria group bacterium]
MAIDIIPKPPEEEPIWLNILFYISIGFLISVILIYFLLGHLQRNSEEILEGIEISLQVAQTSEERELENSVLQYKRKIDDFAIIFSQHKTNSGVFPFFEEITHPEIQFSSFQLAKPSVTLSGTAENFVALAQQLSIFQKNPKVSTVNLSQISSGEDGNVGFIFTLTLLPEIFEFK